MGAHILESIRTKREQLPAIGKVIIGGQVHGILKNFNEIKGRDHRAIQIYRIAGRDMESMRLGLLARMFDFFAALSFRNEERGDLLLDEFGTWRAWRRQTVPDEFRAAPVADFMMSTEDLGSLCRELRMAYIAADTLKIKTLLSRARRTIESLEYLNEIDSSTAVRERSATIGMR